VIDAIDQARTKAAMIAWCKRHSIPVITSGSAGGQIDPTRIQIADLAHTVQDPLLAKVRALLRKDYGFTRDAKKKFGIPAIYSTEPLRYPANSTCNELAMQTGLNCTGFGSSVCVTAPFGLFAVAEVLKCLSSRA
jgi:tRNA A37 threonylcarbamoyladenosine dehydratase